MPALTRRSAVAAINRLGACLVFPLNNRAEPASLWAHFHPRTKMRWEWDAGGDDRVPALWHLREELARSGQVVYTKWFRGRATFFSLDVFAALVHLLAGEEDLGLGMEARTLYQCFEESSPLSTKEVKRAADLQGSENSAAYERGMKELWSRGLVVAFGERDDGAFPSLLVGATKWVHEPTWRRGREMADDEAMAIVNRFLADRNPFRHELERLRSGHPRRAARQGSAQPLLS
jgi:hypothetical protein